MPGDPLAWQEFINNRQIWDARQTFPKASDSMANSLKKPRWEPNHPAMLRAW